MHSPFFTSMGTPTAVRKPFLALNERMIAEHRLIRQVLEYHDIAGKHRLLADRGRARQSRNMPTGGCLAPRAIGVLKGDDGNVGAEQATCEIAKAVEFRLGRRIQNAVAIELAQAASSRLRPVLSFTPSLPGPAESPQPSPRAEFAR